MTKKYRKNSWPCKKYAAAHPQARMGFQGFANVPLEKIHLNIHYKINMFYDFLKSYFYTKILVTYSFLLGSPTLIRNTPKYLSISCH